MPDRFDDLLRQLPLEAMAEDLPGRVQARLHAGRAQERHLHRLIDAVSAVLVFGGVLVLAPTLGGVADGLTGGSLESSLAWVGRLGSAPAPVIWDTLAGAWEWTRALSGRLGVGGLLGLILVSLPLFVWLHRLMPAASFEPDGAVPMVEEGAVA